jgi:hypothetical protein
VLVVVDRPRRCQRGAELPQPAEVQLIEPGELNAYDVLCNDWIVFTQATLPSTIADDTAVAADVTPAAETASIEKERLMKDPRDIIIAGRVREELRPHRAPASTPSRSTPAIQARDPRCRRGDLGRRGLKVNTLNRPGKRSGRTRGTNRIGQARHQARHRHAGRGRDPAVRELRSPWASVQAQAHERRPPLPDVVRLLRDHQVARPEKSLLGVEAEDRWSQRLRPQDRPPPRRRPQAAVPPHRLQAHQGRRDRPRSPPSSTTPTARAASPCCTTPTARRPTSSPQGPQGGRPRESGQGADIKPGNACRCATSPSVPSCTTSSCARPGRQDRPARPVSPCSSSPRTATSPRCACRPPRCAAC